MALRIVLADDHGLFRDSMAAWLEHLETPAHITAVASYAEVRDALRDDRDIGLVLLDLGMPGMQGALSVRELCRLADATPIIVVSADDNPVAIRSCLDAGASGYVPKSASGETILQSIRLVLDGGTYVPREINFAAHASLPKFSDKQMRLLALLAEGRSNREISRLLFLSEGTVKQYVSAILRTLQVDNRTQAGIRAREILGIGQS
ncbi:MAG: response regulator transcription factor [Mariprofundaceae bacterium]